jgi:hypothetical protein
MEVLYSRCCGLDFHKSTISACVLIREGSRTHKKYSRYGATTRDMEEFARWVHELGVTHVAMESTGVYQIGPSFSVKHIPRLTETMPVKRTNSTSPSKVVALSPLH